MSNIDVADGPRPYDPARDNPHPRLSLGPGYDWLLELLRQLYRPALGLVCVLALADHTIFSSWWRAGGGRLDEMSLLIVVGLAGALAGLRTAELTMARPR